MTMEDSSNISDKDCLELISNLYRILWLLDFNTGKYPINVSRNTLLAFLEALIKHTQIHSQTFHMLISATLTVL